MTLPGLLAAHDHPAWEDFGTLEWILVAVCSLFMIWVIWKAVQYTMSPGEESPDHVKRVIFQPDEGVSSSTGSDDPADDKRSE